MKDHNEAQRLHKALQKIIKETTTDVLAWKKKHKKENYTNAQAFSEMYSPKKKEAL